MNPSQFIENPDVILIGSGVMSANLAALLKKLEPALTVQLYEVTEELAQESSHGWNNAGTGHAGICELSYTPHREKDGTVKIDNAVRIFEEFEHSLQFWSHALASGMVGNASDFINPIPHVSFVNGAEQVEYLRARHAGMSAHHFFEGMEFTTDPARIAEWAPLLMDGRGDEPVAATKMDTGTDVNFGGISRKLLAWFGGQAGAAIATNHRVVDLDKVEGGWKVRVRNLATGAEHSNRAKFVFVGAGGGSLKLLQKSGIPESRGFGGFPIGGQWLVCKNQAIIKRHAAKVYGQALGAAPTMAVPHLDTRFLDGEKTLLFGPFAAWTTKFLHGKGSRLDLFSSIKTHNLATLLKVGWHNLDLVRYLMQQGTQSMADRMEVLHVFYPAAKAEDWKLVDAGIRVQAIKKTDGEAGIVHYGTEVITNADRTLSALMGASPGASVSVSIVLEVIQTCLPHLLTSPQGRARIKEMVPSFGANLKDPAQAAYFREIHRKALGTLKLI